MEVTTAPDDNNNDGNNVFNINEQLKRFVGNLSVKCKLQNIPGSRITREDIYADLKTKGLMQHVKGVQISRRGTHVEISFESEQSRQNLVTSGLKIRNTIQQVVIDELPTINVTVFDAPLQYDLDLTEMKTIMKTFGNLESAFLSVDKVGKQRIFNGNRVFKFTKLNKPIPFKMTFGGRPCETQYTHQREHHAAHWRQENEERKKDEEQRRREQQERYEHSVRMREQHEELYERERLQKEEARKKKEEEVAARQQRQLEEDERRRQREDAERLPPPDNPNWYDEHPEDVSTTPFTNKPIESTITPPVSPIQDGPVNVASTYERKRERKNQESDSEPKKKLEKEGDDRDDDDSSDNDDDPRDDDKSTHSDLPSVAEWKYGDPHTWSHHAWEPNDNDSSGELNIDEHAAPPKDIVDSEIVGNIPPHRREFIMKKLKQYGCTLRKNGKDWNKGAWHQFLLTHVNKSSPKDLEEEIRVFTYVCFPEEDIPTEVFFQIIAHELALRNDQQLEEGKVFNEYSEKVNSYLSSYEQYSHTLDEAIEYFISASTQFLQSLEDS